MPAAHAKAGSCALMCSGCRQYTRTHLKRISKCETSNDTSNYDHSLTKLIAETVDNRLMYRTLAMQMSNQLFEKQFRILAMQFTRHRQESADLLVSEEANPLEAQESRPQTAGRADGPGMEVEDEDKDL
jgi:hypothetical protein